MDKVSAEHKDKEIFLARLLENVRIAVQKRGQFDWCYFLTVGTCYTINVSVRQLNQ